MIGHDWTSIYSVCFEECLKRTEEMLLVVKKQQDLGKTMNYW